MHPLKITVENNSTIPIPKGNIPEAFIPELTPELISHEANSSARAPRVFTQAPKPRWTRVVRINTTPTVAISQGNPSYGKRTLTPSDDHPKLPNKRYQVSRSEENDCIELAEADTQPC